MEMGNQFSCLALERQFILHGYNCYHCWVVVLCTFVWLEIPFSMMILSCTNKFSEALNTGILFILLCMWCTIVSISKIMNHHRWHGACHHHSWYWLWGNWSHTEHSWPLWIKWPNTNVCEPVGRLCVSLGGC